jgi:hypothetical protein
MLRARALALLVVVGAFAFGESARADPRFDPSFGVTLAQPAPQVLSEITLSFRLESGPQMAATVIYIPRDWGIVPGDLIPVGAKVGFIDSIETFGLINSSCSQEISWRFELQNASLDPASTVSLYDYEQGFDPSGGIYGPFVFAEDRDKNGLADAVDHYPDFLNDALNGERPLVRLAAVSVLAGIPHLRQLLIFTPGTRLNVAGSPTAQSLTDAGVSGYPMVLVSADFRNLDGARQPGPITDYCTPGDFTISLSSVENGQPLLVNPQAGSYGFTLVSISKRDADADGFENSLDTCPFVTNVGDPTALGSGDADQDGLDAVCDTNDDPIQAGTNSDEDGDRYLNRQDNCPLVQNGVEGYGWTGYRDPPSEATADSSRHADADSDDIGDACDPNPDSPDGEELVVTRAVEVVVGEASGSGGPPRVDACPLCHRADGSPSEGEAGGEGGQLAVALGLIAVGAGAGAVLVGSGAAYLIRRRRG